MASIAALAASRAWRVVGEWIPSQRGKRGVHEERLFQSHRWQRAVAEVASKTLFFNPQHFCFSINSHFFCHTTVSPMDMKQLHTIPSQTRQHNFFESGLALPGHCFKLKVWGNLLDLKAGIRFSCVHVIAGCCGLPCVQLETDSRLQPVQGPLIREGSTGGFCQLLDY